MMIRYFRTEDGYVGVTSQCPRGMKGVVYIGRGPRPGEGVGSVHEQAYAVNQLERMEKVEAEDVPDEWFAAIGYEKRLEPKPRTVELVIQFPWEARRKRKKPAKPGSRRYRRERAVFWIALAISVITAWYVVFVWQYQ